MARKEKELDELGLDEVLRLVAHHWAMLNHYIRPDYINMPGIRENIEPRRTALEASIEELVKRFNAPMHYEN